MCTNETLSIHIERQAGNRDDASIHTLAGTRGLARLKAYTTSDKNAWTGETNLVYGTTSAILVHTQLLQHVASTGTLNTIRYERLRVIDYLKTYLLQPTVFGEESSSL